MTKLSSNDLLGWAEAAIFVAAAATTIIYVCARLLVAAVRCGSAARAVALVAGALVFLFVWGFLIFAAFVVTTMAVVSDVQASPAGNESWRHLTVLGVSSAFMVIAGLVACWWARRVTRSLRGL